MTATCIQRRRLVGLACAALPCLIASLGCRDAAKPAAGRVTLDGQPLSEALIMFVPLEPGIRKTGASVEKGHYKIARDVGLQSGRYRVEIIDNPPLDHRPTPELGSAMRSRRVIPRTYGQDSPLVIDVGNDPSLDLQKLNFNLNSRASY